MLLVENQTIADIDIKDLSVTVPASGTYDILPRGRSKISASDQLLTGITGGTLKLIQDELTTPYVYYTTAEAIRVITGTTQSLQTNDAGELITNMPNLHSEVGEKKLWVHNSAKPEVSGKQFYVQYTGVGDDAINHSIGGGNQTIIMVKAADVDKKLTLEFDNDPPHGDVYIHEANIMWNNAGMGDSFSVNIHARGTQLQTIVSKDLVLEPFGAGSFIKLAPGGPGTGTHGFAANPVLVKDAKFTGYWDYSTTAGLTPNVGRTGGYNIFDVDLKVNTFINRIPLFGTSTSYTRIVSNDTAWIPPGYYIEVCCHNASQTDWTMMMYMTVYREQTF